MERLTLDFHQNGSSYIRRNCNQVLGGGWEVAPRISRFRECCLSLILCSEGHSTKGNGFKLKEPQFRLDVKRFLQRAVKLAQVLQRDSRCPVPGNIQGQVGQGSEQPGLVGGVPEHHRTRWHLKVPSNPSHSMILWFCASLTWLLSCSGTFKHPASSSAKVACQSTLLWLLSSFKSENTQRSGWLTNYLNLAIDFVSNEYNELFPYVYS